MTTPRPTATQAPAGSDVPAERQRRQEGMIILSATLAVLLFLSSRPACRSSRAASRSVEQRHFLPADQPQPYPARPARLPGRAEPREADLRAPPARILGSHLAHPSRRSPSSAVVALPGDAALPGRARLPRQLRSSTGSTCQVENSLAARSRSRTRYYQEPRQHVARHARARWRRVARRAPRSSPPSGGRTSHAFVADRRGRVQRRTCSRCSDRCGVRAIARSRRRRRGRDRHALRAWTSCGLRSAALERTPRRRASVGRRRGGRDPRRACRSSAERRACRVVVVGSIRAAERRQAARQEIDARVRASTGSSRS